MVFGDALERMKSGARMTRRGWPFPDVIRVEYTEKDLLPYLAVQVQGREPIPYYANSLDIFADDWEVVP